MKNILDRKDKEYIEEDMKFYPSFIFQNMNDLDKDLSQSDKINFKRGKDTKTQEQLLNEYNLSRIKMICDCVCSIK